MVTMSMVMRCDDDDDGDEGDEKEPSEVQFGFIHVAALFSYVYCSSSSVKYSLAPGNYFPF